MEAKAVKPPFVFSPVADLVASTASGETVRLQTLVNIRWISVIGQTLTLLFVRYVLDFDMDLVPSMAVVGLAALVNALLALRYTPSTHLTDKGAMASLAFDLLQLGALLYLNGGLLNPFALLLVVPVTISATILSGRSTLMLWGLAVAVTSFLAFFQHPLPWPGTGLMLPNILIFFPDSKLLPDAGVWLPNIFIIGAWAALLLGMSFMCIYAHRLAAEGQRMSEALNATQMALAREQKMSALGGLAAAAAHELGTPLGTITVVAKELSKEIPKDSPLYDDVCLLASQAQRCREILARLSRKPEEDPAFEITSIIGLIEAATAPHLENPRRVVVNVDVLKPDISNSQPMVRRSPEIIHAIGNLIENAVEFAGSRVWVKIDWDEENIRVDICDDGPGMPPEILGRLGEPYMSSRRGHGGMGLGVFIAKTLLERTGARIVFRNRRSARGRVRGVNVAIIWSRGILEAQKEQNKRMAH